MAIGKECFAILRAYSGLTPKFTYVVLANLLSSDLLQTLMEEPLAALNRGDHNFFSCSAPLGELYKECSGTAKNKLLTPFCAKELVLME